METIHAKINLNWPNQNTSGVARTPQTSKIETFSAIVNSSLPLIIVGKLSILDVLRNLGYASDIVG